MPKDAKNSNNLLSSFVWLETTPKNVTRRFHTMCGSRDTHFRAFFGPNSSRTELFTDKPMVVGCVQHYSTHFVKKLVKSLESFFRKVQKTAKIGNNGQKCRF